MKTLEEIIETLGASEFTNKAVEKTEEITKGLTKEFKTLVGQIKNIDLNHLADSSVVEAIKDNVGTALSRVQEIEMLEYAKGKVHDTKNSVFAMLNIPSQVEVDNLTRKLVALEKKLSKISKSKARSA